MNDKRIIRVFPRRTSATPTDELAYVGLPDFWAEADEILADDGPRLPGAAGAETEAIQWVFGELKALYEFVGQ